MTSKIDKELSKNVFHISLLFFTESCEVHNTNTSYSWLLASTLNLAEPLF